MNPADVPNIEAMLQLWMLGMIRPGAAFLAAPVFGAANVPVQLRLVIALAVGVPAVAASGMALPADGIVSVPGFLLIIGEVVIGLAIGFVLQMGLAAALLAGETISNTMGLGFASMVDPLSGTSSSVAGRPTANRFIAGAERPITPMIIWTRISTEPTGSAIVRPAANIRLAKWSRPPIAAKEGKALPGGNA